MIGRLPIPGFYAPRVTQTVTGGFIRPATGRYGKAGKTFGRTIGVRGGRGYKVLNRKLAKGNQWAGRVSKGAAGLLKDF